MDADSKKIRIKVVFDAFVNESDKNADYRAYISAIVMPTVLICEMSVSGMAMTKENFEAHSRELAAKGVDADSPALLVLLNEALPPTLTLPSEYWGFPVYTKIVGVTESY
jgi:hypothetical protein